MGGWERGSGKRSLHLLCLSRGQLITGICSSSSSVVDTHSDSTHILCDSVGCGWGRSECRGGWRRSCPYPWDPPRERGSNIAKISRVLQSAQRDRGTLPRLRARVSADLLAGTRACSRTRTYFSCSPPRVPLGWTRAARSVRRFNRFDPFSQKRVPGKWYWIPKTNRADRRQARSSLTWAEVLGGWRGAWRYETAAQSRVSSSNLILVAERLPRPQAYRALSGPTTEDSATPT